MDLSPLNKIFYRTYACSSCCDNEDILLWLYVVCRCGLLCRRPAANTVSVSIGMINRMAAFLHSLTSLFIRPAHSEWVWMETHVCCHLKPSVLLAALQGMKKRDGGHEVDTKCLFMTDGASPSVHRVVEMLTRNCDDAFLTPIPQSVPVLISTQLVPSSSPPQHAAGHQALSTGELGVVMHLASYLAFLLCHIGHTRPWATLLSRLPKQQSGVDAYLVFVTCAGIHCTLRRLLCMEPTWRRITWTRTTAGG